MLSAALGLALLTLTPQEPRPMEGHLFYPGDPKLATTRIGYLVETERLPESKLSPKKFGKPPKPFEFEWIVRGLGKVDNRWTDRLRVYSQQRKQEGDLAPLVARMAMRLWDFNMQRLRFDHAQQYNRGIIDFYLCWGGEPGGEQTFDWDVVDNPPRQIKVNTIYIYDLQSFNDPLEMAREVAHEYGHATLTPIGDYTEPESWANGYLGEKMYLRYLRNEMRVNRMEPIDAMGATLKQLDDWVKRNVDPLVVRAAVTGPQPQMLAGKDAASMDSFLGLALYMESILPPNMFARTLKVINSDKARDYPEAILTAVQERERVVIELPAILKDKEVWVPLSPKAKITGAEIVKRNGDWAQIKPGIGAITLVHPPQR
jgi:hypothetical protein